MSNADKNGTGANPGPSCTHAYCSTRDGSASQNGNGGGKAGGKPCAGCVGKADNKNPKGQRPNGNDHNNGYECDGNNGIGKGNPAHTGCTAGTTPETPSKPEKPGKPGKPDKPCNNGNLHNGKPCTPGTPGTPETPTPPVVVLPNPPIDAVITTPIVRVPSDQGLQVLPNLPVDRPLEFGPANNRVRAQASSLPFTGADAALLAQLGVVILLIGACVHYLARNKRGIQV